MPTLEIDIPEQTLDRLALQLCAAGGRRVTDITAILRARIVMQAGNRCGYCRAHQQYVYEPLHIEHIAPRVRGGSDDEANLRLACALCNRAKRDQTQGQDPVTGRRVRLFHSRRQQWKPHFPWKDVALEGSQGAHLRRESTYGMQLHRPVDAA
jgi:hypothetical protein